MFTGMTMETPAGIGGFNANVNLSQVQTNELIQAENITYEFGTLQKEGGSKLFTPSPIGAFTIQGGHDWFPNIATIQRSVIVCSDSKIRKDSGAGTYATLLNTMTTVADNVVFVEGGVEQAANPRKLFIYTGTNPIQVLTADGSTTTDLAVPATDFSTIHPIGGCIHKNRHWAFGGANSHWIYGSDPLNHEDFGAPKTASGKSTSGSNIITLSANVPATWNLGDGVVDASGNIPAAAAITGIGVAAGLLATQFFISANATGTDITNQTITATNLNAINLPVYPGVGHNIAAITSFKGQLIVFKYPRGLYYVNMDDPNPVNWFTVPLSLEIGIAGPLGWCPVDDDILFCDATGSIHMLSAVLAFGDYGLRSVSDIQYIRNYIVQNVNQVGIPGVQSIFYLAKREAHFALPAIGSSVNSIRLVVDFNNPQKIRFRYSTKDMLASLWLSRDTAGIPRPVGGDTLGQVWLLDQADKSVNNVGYNSIFQTGFIDFSDIDPRLAARRKNFKFLELIGDSSGNWSLIIDIYIDGQYQTTVLFSQGLVAPGLGSFILGTDVLGTGTAVSARHRISGSGKRISIVGSLAGANQDFSVSQFIFSFVPAGESDDH